MVPSLLVIEEESKYFHVLEELSEITNELPDFYLQIVPLEEASKQLQEKHKEGELVMVFSSVRTLAKLLNSLERPTTVLVGNSSPLLVDLNKQDPN